jgi:hypothetical protein
MGRRSTVAPDDRWPTVIGCRVALVRWPSYETSMRRSLATCRGVVILLLCVIAVSGHAADSKKPGAANRSTASSPPERLGGVDNWTAYAYQEKSGKVCYLTSEPQKSEPVRAKRKPALAMITHRPSEKIANVVSIVEGYPLKEGSDVALEIGGVKFDLFTKGDSAWARTSELDKAIVEAMARGKQAVVRGTPQKGPSTTDNYSLAGFPPALAMIDKACDIKR